MRSVVRVLSSRDCLFAASFLIISSLSLLSAQEYPQDENQDYANDRKKHMTGGVDDPLRAGDPVHTIEFKEQFEHVDGTITHEVLNLLQLHKPVSAGAMPPILGIFMAACLLASVAACYMFGNQCFKPREGRSVDMVLQQIHQHHARPKSLSSPPQYETGSRPPSGRRGL
mmetsp:Transcript_12122/g.26026  ORF Transcript_12122/g.26026 Transcript_12122/m.26026 type:complete len:170 (-) Transcript_12122:98-607(-)